MANREVATPPLHFDPPVNRTPSTGHVVVSNNGAGIILQWLEEIIAFPVTANSIPVVSVSKIPAHSIVAGVSAIVLSSIPGTIGTLVENNVLAGTLLSTVTTNIGAAVAKSVAVNTDTVLSFSTDVAPTGATGSVRVQAWWWNITPLRS